MMNKKDYIEDLLRKFQQGVLSPAEAKDLASLAKEGDKNTQLRSVLESFWNGSSDKNLSIPSSKILETIKGKLTEEDRSQETLQAPRILKLSSMFKYAAVIILTMGLTWVMKDLFNHNLVIIGGVSGKDISEITVSYGSKSKVALPDGSVVNLNSGSILRYSAHFDRTVFIEGEAFFDVKKDPEHPFFVKTNEIVIKVLGTKFNVKSYADEKTIQTTLVTGSIEIYANKEDVSDKSRLLVLKPNQQAVFAKENGVIFLENEKNASDGDGNNNITPLIRPIAINSQVDVNSVIAWKDSRLLFRDESFKDLVRKLERWYDVQIDIKDDELAGVQFSGVFVKESIEQALNAMRLVTPFNFKMNKNHIIISK
jgi:transmembrane sensor